MTDGTTPIYNISVQVSADVTLVFRTKELIDQQNACSIRGRGTRVWEVVPADDEDTDPGKHVVLKDSWVDADRTREGKVLDKIAAGDMSDDDRVIFQSCFLTVLAQGDVVVNDKVDNTRSLLTNGEVPPKDCRFNLMVPESRAIVTNSRLSKAPTAVLRTTQAVATMHGAVVDYSPKTRYRIVFRQRCTPLYQMISLHSAFTHLANVVLGQ